MKIFITSGHVLFAVRLSCFALCHFHCFLFSFGVYGKPWISVVLFLSISILYYPITLEGRRGTTDEFATIPFHRDLFLAALVELAKSIPVHTLILSSYLFFCLPLFLFLFTVP